MSDSKLFFTLSGVIAEAYNVALNEVKGLLSRLKHEILPPPEGEFRRTGEERDS
jgi:hypothetical protein